MTDDADSARDVYQPMTDEEVQERCDLIRSAAARQSPLHAAWELVFDAQRGLVSSASAAMLKTPRRSASILIGH